MKTYGVEWSHLSIEAESPAEAVAKAQVMLLDPNNTATLWDVTDDNGGFIDQLRAPMPNPLVERIVSMLNGKEWDADTVSGIADMLKQAGYEIKEPEEDE